MQPTRTATSTRATRSSSPRCSSRAGCEPSCNDYDFSDCELASGITCYSDEDGDLVTGTPHTIPGTEACGDYETAGHPWLETEVGGDRLTRSISSDDLRRALGFSRMKSTLIGGTWPPLGEPGG